MIRNLILSALFCISTTYAGANDDIAKRLSKLTTGTETWLEGFQEEIAGEKISYHSFRNDVKEGLLTRCTNGQMDIIWETSVVPAGFNGSHAGFVWIAGLDLTPHEVIFDVFINDVKRFEIPSSEKRDWYMQTEDGGQLSYLTVESDQHGDAHGYMTLIAPVDWLKKGSAQTISITGRANGENIWIIVFKATDALSFHLNSLQYNTWMEIEMEESGNRYLASVKSPISQAGKTIDYTYGKTKRSLVLNSVGDYAAGNFELPLSAKNQPFSLNDPNGELFIFPMLGNESNSSRLLAKTVLHNSSTVENNKIVLSGTRNFQPKTVARLLELSESPMSTGEIFLMNSSHQDIAWMDSPEQCIIERDTMLITPTLDMAIQDPGYRFDFEHVLMLKEYIHRHPDKKEMIRQMLSDGRITCGATYIQPYEEMYSGEALARQFYFGLKWLKDEFGYDSEIYWNVDVPGRTLQMPQLMKKAGVNYLMISRQEKGFYKWHSPDGSSVIAYSPGHYANAFVSLQRGFFEAALTIADNSLDWVDFYGEQSKKPSIPLLSSWDMSPPLDYSHHISQWHNISELQKPDGASVPATLPTIRVASAQEYFDAMMSNQPLLKDIHGERPNLWVYIHGPGHQKAIRASREGDILLPMAEKFATANALAEGSFVNYPERQLKKAWEAKIYPDHGWGGKNGDITDAVFWQKYEFAKAEAEKILETSLRSLAAKVETNSNKGRPLVVFNSMHINRTDPVSIPAKFDQSEYYDVAVKNADGKVINLQLTDVARYNDGSLKSATLHFTAAEVPAIGYATFYMAPSNASVTNTDKDFIGKAENDFYRIKFGQGGLTSVFDKQLNKELIISGKFNAGEIFTMRSEGNGAGEFDQVQQPDMHGFDRTGNYDTQWKIETSGPVYTCYTYRQKMRGAVIEQRVKLYHQQKMIRFEPALLNWEGELYREYRMALPLNMTNGQVAYEVPFGMVRVGMDEMEGAAGERYGTVCSEIHPRGIENWIGAGNHEFGVTMSSTVAVADWIDPTNNPVYYPILQPILIASRQSCHWEGNPYLQAGDHHFSFAVTSHHPGWLNSVNFGRQANETLQAVWADHKYATASLPEQMSFFSTGDPNVLISTVKKAEDSDGIILRLVDLEGKNKKVLINSFQKLNEAWLTNLIEEEAKKLNLTNGKLEFELGPHSIETLKFKAPLMPAWFLQMPFCLNSQTNRRQRRCNCR